MANHDKIYIRNLFWKTIIGINPDERREKQDLKINLVLSVNLREPGESDNIEDTVNYKKIKKAIIKLVDDSEFFLLEKLASEIAKLVLSFAGVFEVTVTIDKPTALRFCDSVAVEITRTKEKES